MKDVSVNGILVSVNHVTREEKRKRDKKKKMKNVGKEY
jgi:hypothetical protein